jgi:hypothetical protein
LITNVVTETVVDHLEVVHVEEDDGQGSPIAVQPGDGHLQTVDEQHAIGKTGQRVVNRLMRKLGLQTLALDRVSDRSLEKLAVHRGFRYVILGAEPH